jgi:hypothetical protein
LEGHIYFVDGDCYSRMTRARMIAEHPGMIVHHHDFENWPEGVQAHTTAPLDYLIVCLKWALDGAFAVLDAQHSSVLHGQTLDLAGALISPLLGLAALLFLAWWLAKFRIRFAWIALLFYAVCPILVHGTLLGRPDHQSLLMLTLTIAVGAELALVRRGDEVISEQSVKRWGIVSGLAWGLSLWVSLYEPVILLLVTVGLWLILDRRALLTKARVPGVIAGVAVVAFSLAVEGWPIAVPSQTVRTFFPAWERTVGELMSLSPAELFPWVGWWIVASPVLLLMAWREDRRALPLLLLLLALCSLTLWQARWGYFLGMAFAWTLPWHTLGLTRVWSLLLSAPARRWTLFQQGGVILTLAHGTFLVGWWPLLKDWDTRLSPEDAVQDFQRQKRAEQVVLRDLSILAIGKYGGPFLAAWWLSPQIAYWSRQPGVAGTSHESLPGIVDTARFFLSTDPTEAGAILRRHRVRWVLVDDPVHDYDNSRALLGTAPIGVTMAALLSTHAEDAPEYLVEWKGPAAVRPDGLRFFRLYGVDDVMLPQ